MPHSPVHPSPLLAYLHRNPWTKTLRYLPAILWASLIFWFSSRSDLPTLAVSWQEFAFKKTAHVLIYAGLYFWLWWGTYVGQAHLTTAPKPLALRQILAILLILTLYAATDELHQNFTPTRHPNFTDVIIDLTGASFFATLLQHFSAWPKWLKNRLYWLIPS